MSRTAISFSVHVRDWKQFTNGRRTELKLQCEKAVLFRDRLMKREPREELLAPFRQERKKRK